MLAILFGTKFYLAPRSITNNKVLHKKFHQTDHKSLTEFVKKPLSKELQHIQRMMLRDQHYDLKVKSVPGNQLLIAVALSRTSQSESTPGNDSKEEADEWKKD